MTRQLTLTRSQLTLQLNESPIRIHGASARPWLAGRNESFHGPLLQQIVAREPDPKRGRGTLGSSHARKDLEDHGRGALGGIADARARLTARAQLLAVGAARALGLRWL